MESTYIFCIALYKLSELVGKLAILITPNFSLKLLKNNISLFEVPPNPSVAVSKIVFPLFGNSMYRLSSGLPAPSPRINVVPKEFK